MTIPNSNQAREGYRLAISNAEQLIECGQLLADQALYGPAVSLTILGAEEAIKSSLLIAIASGFNFESSLIRKFLTRHKPRHTVAALWVLYSFVLSEWLSMIEELEDRYPHHHGEGYEEARKRKVSSLIEKLNKMADSPSSEYAVLSELDWWRDSDDLKQRGFYVDFYQGGWEIPDFIEEEDYRQASTAAHNALSQAHSLVSLPEAMTSQIGSKYLDRMKHVLRNMEDDKRN